MKRFLFPGIAFVVIFSWFTNVQAQSVSKTTVKAPVSAIETMAKKRTKILKDELFLSNDQTMQIMQINVDMLKKLENLKNQKLDKAENKKQMTLIEDYTKNKIVSLLTPAQRQRFESKLFTEVYQVHVDKKRAVSGR
jgi:hypothetical protein